MSNTYYRQECRELSGKYHEIIREFHIIWRVVTLSIVNTSV